MKSYRPGQSFFVVKKTEIYFAKIVKVVIDEDGTKLVFEYDGKEFSAWHYDGKWWDNFKNTSYVSELHITASDVRAKNIAIERLVGAVNKSVAKLKAANLKKDTRWVIFNR